MATVAAYNNIQTTNAEQVLDVRGSVDMEITISTAAVILRFAPMIGGMPTGLGIEELHPPKLLNINGEAMGYVGIRSAKSSVPASVTIIATS